MGCISKIDICAVIYYTFNMETNEKNSNYIFVHRVFKGIADAILRVFVPILIYQQTNNLMLSFLWAVLDQIFAGIAFVVLKKFIKKYPIISIILHVFPMVLGQFLLIGDFSLAKIIIFAFLDGFATCLYYGAINLIFGYMQESPSTAKFEIGYKVGKVIFCILSAFVLGTVQNSLIFIIIVSSVLYICCAIPLIVRYKQYHINIDQTKNKFTTAFSNSKWFYFYELSINAVLSFISIVLPLYLYASGLTFSVTGILMALSDLLGILASLTAILFSNKKLHKLFLIICSLLMTATILGILFIKQNVVIYVLTLLLSFAYQGQFVIMFGFLVNDQKQKHQWQDALFYRDIISQGSRMFITSSYLFFPLFPVAFALSAISAVGTAPLSIKCIRQYGENLK